MQLVNIIEIVVSLLLVSVALLSVFSKETFNSVIFLSHYCDIKSVRVL